MGLNSVAPLSSSMPVAYTWVHSITNQNTQPPERTMLEFVRTLCSKAMKDGGCNRELNWEKSCLDTTYLFLVLRTTHLYTMFTLVLNDYWIGFNLLTLNYWLF